MLIGGADSKFKDGGAYKVRITLTPDDGFSFAPVVNAKVNGKDAFVEKLDNEMINIHYYFSPLVAESPCKNGHTFTNYVYNKDATLEKDGTKTAKCDKCAATDTITAPGTKWKNPFADVSTKAFYYTPVLWAYNNNITSGTSYNMFAPNDTCTRGQVVTFLWRAAGSPEPKSNNNPFTDVKEKAYYYKAVLWAVENNVTSGTTPTTFEPNSDCTRGQIVAFLWRSQGTPKEQSNNPFTDVKQGKFYYDAVLWAVKNKITSGTTPTTFEPNSPCTRGQIVSFLYRCIG